MGKRDGEVRSMKIRPHPDLIRDGPMLNRLVVSKTGREKVVSEPLQVVVHECWNIPWLSRITRQ